MTCSSNFGPEKRDDACPRWSFCSEKVSKQEIYFLNGPTTASFSFIFSLFKQTIQFLQQINVKNVQISIQYTALGFKPTTFQTWVVTHYHKTRAPVQKNSFLCTVIKDNIIRLGHFGKILKVLGSFWNLFLLVGKMLNLFFWK